ncbi:MAG: hypothetical protein EZS28_030564 [Streblomastix strix]|uniref:Uncharacterized protein n=1 Tax=Streblomastix strix TaxID=222440 RepID=A0A5J4UU25_9EUKA|nr:MAG: hypothetical protein EZS28_030564 [Streblomastix strix]
MLISALCDLLGIDEMEQQKLRDISVDYILRHPNCLSNILDMNELIEYRIISLMDRGWGGDESIEAVSQKYEVTV